MYNLKIIPAGWILLLLGMIPTLVLADALKKIKIQEASDLYLEGKLSHEKKLPILIMFSMDDCPYCKIVREEFLKPMLRSGDYQDKVIIREIHADRYDKIRDFNGKLIQADALVNRYRASLNPTVVFVDENGQQLAERLVGITTRDYYGGFLDDAIAQSRMQLHKLAMMHKVAH